MKEYNSIEEFIFLNKRYPYINESKELYDMVWKKYILTLTDSDKEIAIDNDKMQDYENGKSQDQEVIVGKIAKSTEKFKRLLANEKTIISIYYGEHWGVYSIYVVVNCSKRDKL